MNIGKYVGRAIYISDENGNDLASTTILEHQMDYMNITVKGAIQSETELVTVLILESDGVYEYRGRIRRVNSAAMSTEISLFNGKIKEARAAKRYNLNLGASVISLVFGDITAPLPQPIDVFVVNLSTSGALLRAKANSLRVDSVVGLRLPIDESAPPLHAKIMWNKNMDDTDAEYGCEFIRA